MLAFPPSAIVTSTIPALVTLGDFIYEIEYEFSGMRLPGLNDVKPMKDIDYFKDTDENNPSEDSDRES